MEFIHVKFFLLSLLCFSAGAVKNPLHTWHLPEVVTNVPFKQSLLMLVGWKLRNKFCFLHGTRHCDVKGSCGKEILPFFVKPIKKAIFLIEVHLSTLKGRHIWKSFLNFIRFTSCNFTKKKRWIFGCRIFRNFPGIWLSQKRGLISLVYKSTIFQTTMALASAGMETNSSDQDQEWNQSTAEKSINTTVDFFEFFGPTHPHFQLIHFTALVCLVIGITIGTYTLFYLIKTGKDNVFHWKVGECMKLLFSPFFQNLFWCAQKIVVSSLFSWECPAKTVPANNLFTKIKENLDVFCDKCTENALFSSVAF